MSGVAEAMMASGDTPAEPSAPPESSRPDDGGLSLDSPSEEGFPEGDDNLAPEKQDDEGEGEMEKYWLRIEPLPPRFGYIQIKKLTRDLLGSDRDLVTGESNNDKRYALICMNSKSVAERLLHKVRGHRPLPGAPALEAEMYSDAEREQRFGTLQTQQRTLQSSVSLAERHPNAGNGGGRRFVLVRRLSQDAKSFAWFRRFPTSTGMKKGQVWGHRVGPRWAALECYSEEEAQILAKELDGFKAPEASEALSTEVVSRHAIEEEERAVKQKYEGASGRNRPQHYDERSDRRNERNFRRSHGRDARRDNRDPREEERHRGRGGYDARRNEDRRPDDRHERRPERKDDRHEGDRRDYEQRRRNHDERSRRPEELPRRAEERWDQRRPDSYREDLRRGQDGRDGRDGRRHEEARRDERDRWYQGDRNYDRQHGGPSGRSRSQREQREYRRPEHERQRRRPEDSRERTAHRHEERGRDADNRNAPSHAQQHQQHAGHASRSRSANANAIARKEARAAFAEAESRAQAAEEMCLQKQKEAQMAAERSSKCKAKFQEVLANMEKKKSQAKALGADADQKMREAELAAREAHLAEVDVEKYKDYVLAAEQDANEANIETAKCAKEAAIAKEEASKLRGLVGKMMIQDEDL